MSKNILFMMSGSIACYKSCDLISKLQKQGHQIQVAATNSALKFVGKASLEGLSGREVFSDDFSSGKMMDHIYLINEADLIILSPASANTLNSFANGVTNNALGSLFLAYDFKKPFVVFPSMNTKMYQHPATQKSIETLKSWGIKVAPSPSGDLACGENGEGRLLETQDSLDFLKEYL
jgi:phosphopantothenoylcysteine decarboxylase/phosphopantothenate--cysteine ligase